MKKIHIIIIGGGGQKVNKDNINISVIIRVSNEERWIGHCIQSVIDKLSDPEIIIVNDSSKDNSINIVKHFVKDPLLDEKIERLDEKIESNYANIKILNIDDYTPGKSLNMGVREASNEVCLVISAHCVLTSIDLKNHLKDLEKFACIFGNQIPYWSGKRINKRYIWSHFTNKKTENMYSDLENRYFHHNAIALYKKSTLIEFPFDENLQHKEDRYWVNDIIANNKKSLYDPELCADHHYTQNGNTWKGLN